MPRFFDPRTRRLCIVSSEPELKIPTEYVAVNEGPHHGPFPLRRLHAGIGRYHFSRRNNTVVRGNYALGDPTNHDLDPIEPNETVEIETNSLHL